MSQHRGRRSSPRRVLFPAQEHKSCELCHGCHTHTSSPNQWNSSQAREFVKLLGVCEDGVVCRPCRKDVSKTVADPSHIPRWNKTRSNCCILDCSEQVYASTKAGSKEAITAILQAQELQYQEITVPTPLCSHHYHLVYNLLQPTRQTNCAVCGISLRHTQSRSCPQPDVIEQHLRETIGFEGHIATADKVCYSCYKSHLVILQESRNTSRDSDLEGIISTLKQASANADSICSTTELRH